MFITSFLMGGLGNQMFQISKALCEGYENNIEVFLDPPHTYQCTVINLQNT